MSNPKPFQILGMDTGGAYAELRLTHVTGAKTEAERDGLLNALRREHPELTYVAHNPDDRDRTDGRHTT